MIPLSGGPLSRLERVALVLSLVMSAVLMFPLRAAVPDIAYCWLHVARHLSQGAGLVFNTGERVYVTTNPLWVTLLADGMTFGLDGLDLARALGALSALISIPLFLQLMRRTVGTPALRALGTLAWAAHASMARWAMSGVETPLAVALVLGGFVALTEGADWGERPIRTGALWSLAALTRPGCVLLLVLWGTALLIDTQNRPGLRRLVFGLLPVVAIYGSWLVFARFSFGTFWPSMLSAVPAVNPSLVQWWARLAVDLREAAHTEGAIALAGLLALALGRGMEWAARPPAKGPDRSALRLLPLAWIVLLPALFAARGLEVSPRHLLLVAPIVHWLAWWAIDHTWSGAKGEQRAWVRAALIGTVVATVVVVQNLIAYRFERHSGSLAREQAVEGVMIRWGRWLRVNAEPGDVVATSRPGAIAYFGGVRVLDFGGHFSATNDLPPPPRGARANVLEWLDTSGAQQVDYLVERSERIRVTHGEATARTVIEPLAEAQGYSFYRVHPSDVPEAPESGP